MELKIDRGLKSYDIEDADGTPLGTIYVNPADLGIAARLDEARKAVQALADGLWSLHELWRRNSIRRYTGEICAGQAIGVI